jgi:hypothetical protein
VTEASHKIFNEFGLKLLDVQLIHFACVDVATQQLLDRDIITRVTKQNELLAKEADVEIMKREKEVQMQQMGQTTIHNIKHIASKRRNRTCDWTVAVSVSLPGLISLFFLLVPPVCCCFLCFVCVSDINFEKQIKENTMELKRKELDVSRRMKEVDLRPDDDLSVTRRRDRAR